MFEVRVELPAHVGDKVFTIDHVDGERVYVKCGFCDGASSILGKDGSVETCPRCGGSGDVWEEGRPGWQLDEEEYTISGYGIEIREGDAVSEIQVDLVDSNGLDFTCLADCVFGSRAEAEEAASRRMRDG